MLEKMQVYSHMVLPWHQMLTHHAHVVVMLNARITLTINYKLKLFVHQSFVKICGNLHTPKKAIYCGVTYHIGPTKICHMHSHSNFNN